MLGDFKQDEFSDEEKAALGEAPEAKEEQAPESQEQTEEKPAEQQAPEEKPEAEQAGEAPESATEQADEGEKVDPVQKRINKLTWEKEELNRKNTLLKQLGRGKYYELYPDEKPADYQAQPKPAQQQPATQGPSYQEMAALRVNQVNPDGTAGPLHGRTLGDLMNSPDAEERLAAVELLTDHKAAVKEQAAKAERDKKSYQESAQKEVNAFEYGLAKETFSKEKDFTPEEIREIKTISAQVIQWMQTPDPQTGRSRAGYSVADAYFVMNRDGLIKTAATKAAQAAVDAVTKPGVKSIGNGGGDVKLTGYEAMLTMSEKQMEAQIDKMPEKEFKKFLKEAPKALRDKYPGVFS